VFRGEDTGQCLKDREFSSTRKIFYQFLVLARGKEPKKNEGVGSHRQTPVKKLGNGSSNERSKGKFWEGKRRKRVYTSLPDQKKGERKAKGHGNFFAKTVFRK